MTEMARKPKIRFKGYTDAWELRKLGEITTIVKGQQINKSRLHSSGTYYVLNGGMTPSGYTDNYNTNDGTISISEGGNSCGFVNYNFEPFWSGGHNYTLLNPKISALFLFQILKYIEPQIMALRVGSGLPNVQKSRLEDVSVYYPQKSEQILIGEYFQKIDNLITLHQRKYDMFVNIKKALLEKMFPQGSETTPKIRFKGFTDAWELRKWADTVAISTEMVDPKTGLYDLLPHVAPGNIESFTGQLYDNIKLVKDENLISGKFHFYDGDIIYGKINPQLGKYVFARFEGLTSADAYVLNAKNGVAQKYLFSILQTKDFFDYSVSVSKRSGMPKINRDELNAYGYFAPSEQNQNKIGELFLSIDNLITLHQRKVEKLKNIKAALLEKMFV